MSEFFPVRTPQEIIREIEAFGFELYVGDDGVVHGRPRERGTRVPWEMRPVLDDLHAQNERVADLIRARADDSDEYETIPLTCLSQAEAQEWAERIRSGEFRLKPGTQVVYNRTTGYTTLTVQRRRVV